MTNEKKKNPNSVTFIEKYLEIYLKIKTWKHQNHQIKNHLVNFRSMQQNRACKKINAFHVVRYLNHDGRLHLSNKEKNDSNVSFRKIMFSLNFQILFARILLGLIAANIDLI